MLRQTVKVRSVRSWAQMFFFLIFNLSQQAKCLTSPTWLKLLVLTRQSWRRRRQKKRTLCPPKRVSDVSPYPAISMLPMHHALCRAANDSSFYKAHVFTLSFLLPHAAIEQERKGDATPWLLSTSWKEDATAKKKQSTFLWLLQCFSLLFCLQIRMLASSLGSPGFIWHPHIGCPTTRVGKL